MNPRKFFIGRAIGFSVLLILVLLIGGFYWLNNYIYEQKQGSAVDTLSSDTYGEMEIGFPNGAGINNSAEISHTDNIESKTPDDMNVSTDNTSGVAKHYESFSIHAIPLGDNKVSTGPKKGYVYSCQTTFRGGGASHTGDWVSGSTWDLTKKLIVEGKVYWSSASFSGVLSGTKRLLTGNGLPVDKPTGNFPISSSDPAYQIDRNPNSIKAQSVSYSLSSNPTFATTSSCVPMGAIGIAINGVAIYNALDDGGRDAVAHEVQDLCSGHPQQAGEYHYHGPSSCMPGADSADTLVGYALDGFGIYSKYDANMHEYTNADLDECHGMTSEILWNGKKVNMYHYVLTDEYPYTIGCFRGAPVKTAMSGQGGGATNLQQPIQNQSGGGTPPQEAINACIGKTNGAFCSFGPVSGGTCRNTPDGSFACVP